MMQKGFYKLTFSGKFGNGSTTTCPTVVAFFDGARLTGGDINHIYDGQVSDKALKVELNLKVCSYPGAHKRVFEPDKDVQIDLSGTWSAGSFKLSGTSKDLPGETITCDGQLVHPGH